MFLGYKMLKENAEIEGVGSSRRYPGRRPLADARRVAELVDVVAVPREAHAKVACHTRGVPRCQWVPGTEARGGQRGTDERSGRRGAEGRSGRRALGCGFFRVFVLVQPLNGNKIHQNPKFQHACITQNNYNNKRRSEVHVCTLHAPSIIAAAPHFRHSGYCVPRTSPLRAEL